MKKFVIELNIIIELLIISNKNFLRNTHWKNFQNLIVKVTLNEVNILKKLRRVSVNCASFLLEKPKMSIEGPNKKM